MTKPDTTSETITVFPTDDRRAPQVYTDMECDGCDSNGSLHLIGGDDSPLAYVIWAPGAWLHVDTARTGVKS